MKKLICISLLLTSLTGMLTADTLALLVTDQEQSISQEQHPCRLTVRVHRADGAEGEAAQDIWSKVCELVGAIQTYIGELPVFLTLIQALKDLANFANGSITIEIDAEDIIDGITDITDNLDDLGDIKRSVQQDDTTITITRIFSKAEIRTIIAHTQ